MTKDTNYLFKENKMVYKLYRDYKNNIFFQPP